MLIPELLVHDDIDNGFLVSVLAEYGPQPRPLHLLTFPDRRPMPKVVSFVQFMLAHLGPVDTSTCMGAESPLRA